jgi:hypothetical protein
MPWSTPFEDPIDLQEQGHKHMDRRSLYSLMTILAIIAAAGPAFADEQIGQSGTPVPTRPFPLFHNPTDQFGPPAPGSTTRFYYFRPHQQRPPSRLPNTMYPRR